jgi:amino acid adenylation domain-containing protein
MTVAAASRRTETRLAAVRARLAGAPALADLGTDRRRPARPTRQEARLAGAPLGCRPDEAVLVAAVAAVLHRYTGQDDVLVAVPADAGLAVVRSQVSGDAAWADLLAATRTGLIDARRAEEIVAAADIAPAAAETAETRDDSLPAVHVVVGGAAGPRDGFDLAVAPSADGAALAWRYATDLFDAPTVARLDAHVGRLLAAVDEQPDRPLARIALLSAEERHQLVVEWNDTSVPFSEGARVHELVLAQAARTPDATAVVFEDGASLTYGALVERASRIAARLVALGVTRGGRVGVYLERSLDMVASLVGVLMTGSAYVPLDPSFPPDRLALMVEDSALQVLVTQSSLEDVLALPPGVERVVLDGPDGLDGLDGLDADEAALDPEPARPGARDESSARDLAYVIYTSGSTGRPKGVMLEHRSVVNFLESMAREPGLVSSDRLLAVTTLSFDIAGLELFLPLVTGATVVVASRATAADPQALQDALTQHAVTVMQATPATWRMLVDAGWTGARALKVLCGGEALPPALAAALVDRAGEVWNMYGPTETTIWSTVQRVVPGAPVSIGRPIANTTLYVLDAAMEPVPIGVAGELYIGGDGLARGYHGLDALTAERFVADPFSNGSGARLYRTGDLVRARADGRIEFLGRVDQQVKVRGFRIELGEIETVLGRHPAVDEAVVLARDDPRGDKRLVAYVTLRTAGSYDGGTPVSAAQLRRSVQDALPHYMVPSVVMFLDGMPRTPNQKTDRKAMPEPDWSLIGRDSPYVAPRDDVETRMAQLWEDQLGIDAIGVQDDFFELGVESIVAARLFARIEREFAIELPVGTVFANPTVEGLATLVRDGDVGAHRTARWKSLVPIQPQGERTPVFGIHGGAGTILLYGELARRLGTAGRPFYGLQAQGLYGHDPVHTSVTQMAAAYLPQIREVQRRGPYVLAGYCFGSLVAYELAQLLVAEGEPVELLVSFNGPSTGYIERHDPDGDGDGDDDEAVPVPLRAAELAGRVKATVRQWVRRRQLWWAVRTGRPLPDRMRENRWFQMLSVRAQNRYTMAPYAGRVAVFRAAGLYREADLGFGETVTGRVDVFEVPGYQPRARWTMKEPTVGFVANELVALLDELEAAPEATP